MTLEEIKEKFPYLYETHLHTSQGSLCGRKTGAQMAQACKDYGYTGIFVTDHNWGGNTAVDRGLPWEEWVDLFAEGYRDAKQKGDEIGLDVFYGWEAGYQGTEFLIYGLTPEWMKQHPELHDADIPKQYEIVKAAGGIVVHAHPYREEDYIPEIRFFPDYVDGVEGLNATHTNPLSKGHKSWEYDPNARAYARQNSLPLTAGSDIHDTLLYGGGMAFARKLADPQDFIHALLGGEDYVFTDGVSWYAADGSVLYRGNYENDEN